MGSGAEAMTGLRLFDTAAGQVLPFEPTEPGRVSMYVCGPTVYDVPHLGHGRFSLVFDILRRYLLWCGLEVTYVSNVTDVDDNIIGRAAREGRTESEIAAEYEQVWWDAMDALGVMRPDETPHATAYIDEMVAFIGELLQRGLAYETPDGVYLDTAQVDGYGLLARQDLDELRAGARVEATEGKRSPVDFVLWKPAKPGEPAWSAPFGEGRPGWHTECVVMSTDLLGDEFDLHGGGLDLAFPHHENERAQAVAMGKPFSRRWVHNGFVEVEGEKMSKSLGNFTSLADLLARTDSRAYRLLVLRSHYRSPVEITTTTIADAEAALDRLDAFARRTAGLDGTPDAAIVERFGTHMDDDLDTPGAVALVFETVRAGNSEADAGGDPSTQAATVREICRAVGLELREAIDEVPPDVVATARRRDEARAGRDFATADALRDELAAAGYVVEDGPDGTLVRPA